VKFFLGVVIVIGSVFGGYILSHGQMAMLMQPFEFLIIAGAALGAFIISSPRSLIVKIVKHIPELLSGSKYNKNSYLDLLGLIYVLFAKAKAEGLLSHSHQ